MQKIDIGIQKDDGNQMETFGIVIASFSMDNKDGKFCFFEKTFLLVDISIDILFRMTFLILSNVQIEFNNWELE